MIIEVPQDVIDRLNDQLKSMPEKAPDALRKTINGTARYGRKDIVRRTREQYVLKKAPGRIKAASEFESARGKYFQATIVIKGSPEPLMNFRVVKNGKREAAKANVLQTSDLKELTTVKEGETLKAFVQKIENEDKAGNLSHHVGIFQRRPRSERGTGGRKRNAMKQLYSTSIPQMVKSDRVYPTIEADIKEELRRSLEEHIAKVMEGLK